MAIRAAGCGLMWLLAAWPLWGQLPDMYKSVDRLVWVVDDLDKAIEGWKKVGAAAIISRGEVDAPDLEYRGKPAQVRIREASGRFGELGVHWIQPVAGDDAYSDFLKRHGSGVFSLVHRAPTREAFDKEVARLKDLGVGVLQRGRIDEDAGLTEYVFFDTEPQGKYALGLLFIPGSSPAAALAIAGNPSEGRRVTQFAFAVRDFEAVSRYWARLGFPEFSITQPKMRELRYRSQPGEFDMKLGWQRHGKVPYEWILSVKGPNVYLDHLARHGEGLHHIAFQVQDMDKASAEFDAMGFPLSQGGAWGEKDKPGSGRFSYHDTQAIGGTDIELLWNYR